VTWNTTRVGAYGPLPGIVPQTLGDVTQLAAATAWRSHRIDPTGFYWLGARYYEPTSGRFLSADPAAMRPARRCTTTRMGDPANRIDPDGRKVSLIRRYRRPHRIAIICINSGTNASATDKAKLANNRPLVRYLYRGTILREVRSEAQESMTRQQRRLKLTRPRSQSSSAPGNHWI